MKLETHLTLVATLHEPIDPTMLAACLSSQNAPMLPWGYQPLEIRISHALQGGACLQIYRRTAPQEPHAVDELQARQQGLQARSQFPAQGADGVPYNEAIHRENPGLDVNASYPGARA